MNVFNQMITLSPLEESDRKQFILDNQRAFYFGAVEEFGMRDDHFEEDGEIISRHTIEEAMAAPDAEVYRIMLGDVKVGGAVIRIEGDRGHLDLLFVSPNAHNCGIGYTAWQTIERKHPEVRIWETMTPYFERRNIHFYVNRCGFHIVEYFNSHHPDPHDHEAPVDDNGGGMFRFEKVMQNERGAFG